MRYVKAAVLGLLVAIVGGAVTGVRVYFALAGGPDASARARASAESIAVALNCAALFALVCVPVAIVIEVVRNAILRRGRGSPR